jgi:hypothetical protein
MDNKPDKSLDYWKQNAEEDYMTTPISVMKYITELEKQQAPDKLQQLIEWMEGEKREWLQSSIAYDVLDEAITKAKELQAEQDEHKNRLSKKIEL